MTKILIKLALIFSFQIICFTLYGGSSDLEEGVYVLNCGRIHNVSRFGNTLKKRFILGDLLLRSWSPLVKSNPCLLVVNEGKTLLWETGIDDDIYGNLKGIGPRDKGIGPFEKVKNGLINWLFQFFVDRPLIEQLNYFGLSYDDIDYVAVSHLHTDHSGNLSKFKRAKILIQEKEFEAGMSDNPEVYNYDPKIYVDFFKKYSQNILKVNHDNFDIFGDGRVILKQASGHTPGHQVLVVNLEKGLRLLSGDLCSGVDAYKNNWVALYNHDRAQAKETLERMKDYIDHTDGKIWIQHARYLYTDNPDEAGEAISGWEDQPVEKVYMGISNRPYPFE